MNLFDSRRSTRYAAIATLCGVLYLAGLMHGRFLDHGWPFDQHSPADDRAAHPGTPHAHDDHEGHDHEHPAAGPEGHDHGPHSENSLALSDSAKKHLGLTDEYLMPIELGAFDRTLSVPAVVVDRPGRTRMPVSAATTGIITHVHAVTGEALSTGDLILEMRLTHEDLVTAQKEFLQALGDRDVEIKEIARIEKVASTGAVSNKTLLDRQYSRDKLDSLLNSQREALRLHGLSESQIAAIESDRRLLTELKIRAPDPDSHSMEELQLSRQATPRLGNLPNVVPRPENADTATPPFRLATSELALAFDTPVEDSGKDSGATPLPIGEQTRPTHHLLVLQDLHVQKGQVVSAGELLCTLADFGELLIEGQAFESEAGPITKAKMEGWRVSALIEESSQFVKLPELELDWVDNEIDPDTRALKFYVRLPNVLLRESRNASGQRHVTWRFRTGQRLQLLVPVERWTEQIVLPVDAVVREGLESFVFQQNGDHFERIAVHERYRDQSSVVIENDGTLYPGDVVARRGAHQMQMALKNRAGGSIDPHAGHSH